MAKFEHLNTEEGLKAINAFFEDHAYLAGFVPCKQDAATFATLTAAPEARFPHLLRWYNHMNSFTAEERQAWPEVECKACKCVCKEEAPAAAVEAPKEEAKPAEEEKKEEAAADEDDFDVFDELTPEELAAIEAEKQRKAAERAAKAEEMARMAKEKGLARSQISIDIKPWDDQTPMDKLEEAVRNIEINGLVWGLGKLVPIGYGIKKLQIVAVVIDDLVCTDDIEDAVMQLDDLVQSMDVVSFNKL